MTAHMPPNHRRLTRSRVVWAIAGFLVGISLILTVVLALTRSGGEVQTGGGPAAALKSAPASTTPAAVCEDAVVKVLVRYGTDAKTVNNPAYLLPDERNAFSDLEYSAFTTAMSDYVNLVNPYMNDISVPDAVGQVRPVVHRVCSKAV